VTLMSIGLYTEPLGLASVDILWMNALKSAG
jgi:hypothetical protein